MSKKTQRLIFAAIVGALYAALTMLLAPISYGPVQFRLSEVLCILPYFLPFTAWGLFFGCLIANFVSSVGFLDLVFGSLATLFACLCVAAVGKRARGIQTEVLACFLPVIWNGLVIGGVLCQALVGAPWEHPAEFLFYALPVALGEFVVMFAVGLPLLRWLPKRKFFAEQLTKLQ